MRFISYLEYVQARSHRGDSEAKPLNFFVYRKICFKHRPIMKTKTCPPKIYFAHLNIKIWLRA